MFPARQRYLCVCVWLRRPCELLKWTPYCWRGNGTLQRDRATDVNNRAQRGFINIV